MRLNRAGSVLAARDTVRWLDWMIAPSLRCDPDRVTQARVVVGAAAGLAATSVVMACLAPVFGVPLWAGAVYLGCGALYGAAAALVRFRAALRAATITVAATFAGIMTLMGLQQHGLQMAFSMWNVGIPLFVIYVVGSRAGIVVGALQAVVFMGVWAIHDAGLALDLRLTPEPSGFTAVSQQLGLPLVAAFGWLYRLSRDRVEARLHDTVDALRAEERKLATVIESTTDSIVSIDPEYRLIHFNTTARGLLAGATGGEPRRGDSVVQLLPTDLRKIWLDRFDRVRAAGAIRFEEVWEAPEGRAYWDVSIAPLGAGASSGFTIYSRNVTARKQDEQRMANLHREMLALSRRAGMADVATNVLHNVGNALSSTIVAAAQLGDHVKRGRYVDLERLAALLPTEPEALARFFVEDNRGPSVVPYIAELGATMRRDETAAIDNLRVLEDGLLHIRRVVQAQQQAAKPCNILEPCDPVELVGTAVRLAQDMNDSVRIETHFAADLPHPTSDHHKLLQILGNLVSNARDAVLAGATDTPTIRISARAEGKGVVFEVEDNGVGIAPEHLDSIFRHGFTTKRHGHGFGLHSAANDAAELGGRMTVRSDGPGCGATFRLDVPVDPPARVREDSQPTPTRAA